MFLPLDRTFVLVLLKMIMFMFKKKNFRFLYLKKKKEKKKILPWASPPIWILNLLSLNELNVKVTGTSYTMILRMKYAFSVFFFYDQSSFLSAHGSHPFRIMNHAWT